MKIPRLFLAFAFVIVSCGRTTAVLPPTAPDPRSNYEEAVVAWMDDGKEVSPEPYGWVAYRFSSSEGDIERLRQEMIGGFRDLCSKAGGGVQERDNFSPAREDSLVACMNGSAPLFAIVAPFSRTPERKFVVTHLNAEQARNAFAEAARLEAHWSGVKAQHAAEAKHEAEAAAEAKSELQALRANVAVGDRIGVLRDDRTPVRALVVEIRESLVQVQTPGGLVWAKRDQLVPEAVATEAERRMRNDQQQAQLRARCGDECTMQVSKKCGAPGSFCPDPEEAREICIAACMDQFR